MLIIDDEKPVRTAVRLRGDWLKLGVGEIFEADNGRSGLEIMNSNNPDIIIVDILMPIMDGFEFLKQATIEFPDKKYIILSGYDEFEFARRGIEFKIIDYLLKPVEKAALNKVIGKAAEQLAEQSERQYEKEIVERSRLERFFQTLMEGTVPDAKAVDQIWTKLLCEKLSWEVVLIRINADMCDNTDANGGKDGICQDIEKLVLKIIGVNAYAFCWPYLDEDINFVLVLGQENGSSNLPGFVADKLRDYFENTCKCGFLLSSGNIIRSMKEFKASFDLARAKLYKHDLRDKSSYCTIEADDAGQSRFSLIARQQVLLDYLKHRDKHRISEIIGIWLKDHCIRFCLSLENAEESLTELILIVQRYAGETSAKGWPSLNLKSWQKDIKKITGIDDYNFLVERIAEDACGIEKDERLEIDATLSKIRNEIENNFSADISLDDLAGKYFYSKQYLQRAYIRKYKTGIHEHLLKVRLDQAEKMLVNTDIPVDTVARMAGYKDSGYFGKIFKKHYGASPKAYRFFNKSNPEAMN